MMILTPSMSAMEYFPSFTREPRSCVRFRGASRSSSRILISLKIPEKRETRQMFLIYQEEKHLPYNFTAMMTYMIENM